MDQPRITQQTSTTLPLTARSRATRRARSRCWAGPSPGALQWALEGPGWSVLRPAVDFVLLCVGGRGCPGRRARDPATSRPCRAPLLALPPLVMLLLYLRGLYRTRLRALVLDGVVPVVSAVSIAAMAVATIGLFANGQRPERVAIERARVAVRADRRRRSGAWPCRGAQRWARGRRLVGKPVLIVGAGLVGSQVARRLESHPEYGLVPVGFLDDDPRSVAEVGGREVPVLGTRRGRR